MSDQKATILSIHESHRTDEQNRLICAAAEVAYEMPALTGYVILAFDANQEYVAWSMPNTDENLTEYVTDTIKDWIEE